MLAVQSRKQLSHERIVAAASRAIRRAGYHGVSVGNVMKEAGLTHGGFYAHFESRDAMLVEAMQYAARKSAIPTRSKHLGNAAGFQGEFAACVQSYLDDRHLTDLEDGCVVAALASEMPRQEGPVLDEARLRVSSLIKAVQQALPEGTDEGTAQQAAATLVGALQLARTLGGKPGKALLARTRKELIEQYNVRQPLA